MIVLYTDFGPAGPYVGQMKGVLLRANPAIPVVDLLANAPAHDPAPAAYLLAACARDFPPPVVFLCVVDPGVGGDRAPCAVRVDGQWFVGPDNGLFNIVAMRGREVEWWEITWRPEQLSATFHGRDLFSPVAARIARGESPPGVRRDAAARIDRSWPDEYPAILYLDHYGNAITGLIAGRIDKGLLLVAGERRLSYARNYSDAPAGQAFWYENSLGLVEIAVSHGSARETLGLAIGDRVAAGPPAGGTA
jgi:S-adenosyl-L-methionine hydrolase (adenosine-forming)